MLVITIPAAERYDEATSTFIPVGEPTIYELEHSLASISKWESKWESPFLGEGEKTTEQTLDYISMMCVNRELNLDDLTQEHMDQITAYITKKSTATTFAERPGAPTPRSKEFISSELIYYWMIALNIEWEAQYWHINRLLTLIRICNEKNKTEKKRGPMNQDARAARRELNAQRRAQMGSKG